MRRDKALWARVALKEEQSLGSFLRQQKELGILVNLGINGKVFLLEEE